MEKPETDVPEPPEQESPIDNNWVDAYAPKDKTEADYFFGKTTKPETPRKSKKRHPLRTLIICLVLIAGGVVVAYVVGNRAADTTTPATKTTTATPQKIVPKTVATKQYTAPVYGIGFDYPETWTVRDVANKLTVTSPETTFRDAAGKSVTGHVQVVVRVKQPALSEFSSGSAVAQQDSEKITCKQPSDIQRAQSYVSYITYATNATDGLDALYITGDSGYQAQQVVPQADVVKSDPLIAVTFVACTSSDCGSGTVTPISILGTSWKENEFFAPVFTLLESIAIG